ncbi:elongation factor Tu [Candidatus Poribacteria bacterium]|nr:elongation factor Tu [Candidatus Poribacteria bacterium]
MEAKRIEPRINICTIGHFGHGKTTLVAAMTKVLAMIGRAEVRSYESLQNPHERWESGMPIAMAQVDYETSGKQYSHFDCVNHIDHVKNLIDGPVPISGAILVVSSVDGVTSQTEEQVRLVRKVKVPIVAVFLNKIDLVKDEELVELNEMEIKELLSSYGFDKNNTPIIAGSAKKSLEYRGNNLNYDYWQPILQLTMELTSRVVQPQQEVKQPFLMTIEDVFNIEGKGIVVTGTIKRGNLAIRSPLQIVGLQSPISTMCVGTIEDINSTLFKEEEETPKVAPEERQIRTGFLLDVEGRRVEKGQVLVTSKSIAAHTNFEAEVYHLAIEEGGKHAPLVFNDRIQFDFWTADITGKVSLSEDKEINSSSFLFDQTFSFRKRKSLVGIIPPGQNGSITVDLEKPVAMEKGSRFIMKKDGGKMGVGVVTDIL